MQARQIHADILVPTKVTQSEDICWQRVTYKKVNQFYVDHKVSLFLFLV